MTNPFIEKARQGGQLPARWEARRIADRNLRELEALYARFSDTPDTDPTKRRIAQRVAEAREACEYAYALS